jgi:ATP-binding protein involved in chromosome partitioning
MGDKRAGPRDIDVLDALKQVVDPQQGRDIVSLGMISGLTLRDGHALFSIEVDPARGAAMEPVRLAAERAVAALPGILSVTAVLTAHRAAPAAPRRVPTADRRQAVPGVARVIAVASGKGGVGKSTTAVNLALALAAAGQRVGLLDADIYGPSVPRMTGVSGKPLSPDGKTLDPKENFGLKIMSIGFLIDEETPMIWRGPMVQSALTQMLREVNWGTLDILVVDMPPGTGDAQLTMAQQVPLAGAVIVSTPQDIALLDARKALAMFRKVEVPVLGIVENMSYYRCPNCGHRAEIFGHGGARAVAEKLGAPFLGEIPLDIRIRETSDQGRPVVALEPDGPHAAAYRAVAAGILAALDRENAFAPPRIIVE